MDRRWSIKKLNIGNIQRSYYAALLIFISALGSSPGITMFADAHIAEGRILHDNIEQLMTELVKRNTGTYKRYIGSTEGIYAKIERLLELEMGERGIAISYEGIADMGLRGTRKMAVDSAIEKMAGHNSNNLSYKERLAMGIYRYLLIPLKARRVKYIQKTSRDFACAIRQIVEEMGRPISIVHTDEYLSVLLVLKSDEKEK